MTTGFLIVPDAGLSAAHLWCELHHIWWWMWDGHGQRYSGRLQPLGHAPLVLRGQASLLHTITPPAAAWTVDTMLSWADPGSPCSSRFQMVVTSGGRTQSAQSDGADSWSESGKRPLFSLIQMLGFNFSRLSGSRLDAYMHWVAAVIGRLAVCVNSWTGVPVAGIFFLYVIYV